MKRTIKATKYEGGGHSCVVNIAECWDSVPSEFEISWDEPDTHKCDKTPEWAKINNKHGGWWLDIWVWDSAREVQIVHCPFCGVKL
jgi:hypothetical protein